MANASGSQVDAIYTDFSKAFDRVNVIFLDKLEAPTFGDEELSYGQDPAS